jgi:ATP-dependent Clp protease adaptor protein ClpS
MPAQTAVDLSVAVEEAPAAPKQRKRRSRTRHKRQPPYAVILENDEFHSFAYVIEVLQRVCGHGKTRAFLLTTQIHFAGRGTVWSGSREVAELKRDQIRGYGPDFYAPKPVRFPLGVTIEPLPGE